MAAVASVAILEDDPVVCESLRLLLDATTTFCCVGTCSDGQTALAELPKWKPEIVLVDLGLPRLSGIEVIGQLAPQLPTTAFVVLTMHENEALVFEALCAGACGYLYKSESPARILAALAEVQAGGAPMSSQVARLVVASFQRKQATIETLTDREQQVLSELCQGKSYTLIAESLFISLDTVRSHIRSIYRKLNVHSKSAAVAKAYESGLV